MKQPDERPADQLARKLMSGGEVLWRVIVWGLIALVVGGIIYAATATPPAIPPR